MTALPLMISFGFRTTSTGRILVSSKLDGHHYYEIYIHRFRYKLVIGLTKYTQTFRMRHY